MFSLAVEHSELFPCSKRIDKETRKEAEEFVKVCKLKSVILKCSYWP